MNSNQEDGLGYRQQMAKNFTWKAGLGAVAAYVLSLPIAFGALLAMACGAATTYLLIEHGVVGDE